MNDQLHNIDGFSCATRSESLAAVAWCCTIMCIAIIVVASTIAWVFQGRSAPHVDPLPVLRWESIR